MPAYGPDRPQKKVKRKGSCTNCCRNFIYELLSRNPGYRTYCNSCSQLFHEVYELFQRLRKIEMMIDIARYSSPFNDPLNSFTQTLEKSDGHLESKKEELLFKIIEAEKKLEAKIQSKKDEARQRELSKPKGPCVRCGRLTQYNCSYCENFLCSDCGSFCSDDCDYYFYYSD